MSSYSFFSYAPTALTYDSGQDTYQLRQDYDFREHRNRLEIEDDDIYFDGDFDADEVGEDQNQTAQVFNGAGDLVASGKVYVEHYGVLQAPDGSWLYLDRIEIGGVRVGYLPTTPLDPDVNYKLVRLGNVDDGQTDGDGDDQDYNSQDSRLAYSQYESVPCFGPGTLVRTLGGWRSVEALRIGDRVMTLDSGPRALRWVHHVTQTFNPGQDHGRPVVIQPAAFGAGAPRRNLILSPHHRVLVGPGAAFPHAFAQQRLVPAKALLDQSKVRLMRGVTSLTWTHLLCDGHEIINAEGCWTETMFLGDMMRATLSPAARTSLDAALGASKAPAPARPFLSVRDTRASLSQAKAA
ncbi:Hint domain-containing protein [Litoreibacter roseus]|uniref:Hedgehog/Intein (Hint) domain-containing protein n=1 Tax=Litoreibacter roseus TaxID=2601869 RepID=A0A6N6JIP0_9RHOB|nr:Hint domain-containing protein [Litoreibacter roseus]GFE65974.1 hypothetical protein KIN_30480 [Litoreibacter roseus]